MLSPKAVALVLKKSTHSADRDTPCKGPMGAAPAFLFPNTHLHESTPLHQEEKILSYTLSKNLNTLEHSTGIQEYMTRNSTNRRITTIINYKYTARNRQAQQ